MEQEGYVEYDRPDRTAAMHVVWTREASISIHPLEDFHGTG